MSEPVAMKRAQALERFSAHTGAPLSDFQVGVNLEEAMEMIDWLDNDLKFHPTHYNVRALRKDIRKARRSNDPWLVLSGFRLRGMEFVRQQ